MPRLCLKLGYYASIMLDALACLLCLNLCWHNRPRPIAKYQRLSSFVYMCLCVTHESSLNMKLFICKSIQKIFNIIICDSHTQFRSIPMSEARILAFPNPNFVRAINYDEGFHFFFSFLFFSQPRKLKNLKK